MMDNGKVSIRVGHVGDMPQLLDLVRELAAYERSPEAVITTVEDFERDLAAGWFDLLVAEVDNEVVGIALTHKAYSTWKGRMLYLDDLVVREAWRSKGIGKLLFDAVADRARAMGARVLKWQVLDWNEPALRFYARSGAEVEPGWLNGRLYLK